MQTINKIIISRIEDIHLKRIAEELKDSIADKTSEATLANLLPAETIYHDINLLHQTDHLTCILVTAIQRYRQRCLHCLYLFVKSFIITKVSITHMLLFATIAGETYHKKCSQNFVRVFSHRNIVIAQSTALRTKSSRLYILNFPILRMLKWMNRFVYLCPTNRNNSVSVNTV